MYSPEILKCVMIYSDNMAALTKQLMLWLSFKYVAATIGNLTLLPSMGTFEVDEGQNVPSISCFADCNPSCMYSWNHNGQVYMSGQILTLTNVRRSDFGIYECNVWNRIGESVPPKAVYIKVFYGPDAVLFSPPDTYYNRTENDIVPVISCDADCNPRCTFTWTMPGGGVTYTSPTLRLNTLNRQEQGVYTCTAFNRIARNSASITVVVNYGAGSSLAIYPADTLYEVMENATIDDVTCSADCRPPCKITWNSTCTSNILSFDAIKRSEAGTYTCTANNIAETSSMSVTIKVKYRAEIKSLNIVGKHRIMEGGKVKIDCVIDGYPRPSVMWVYRENGTVLKRGSRVTKSTLTIRNANCFDTGTYTCSAYNEIGEAVSENIQLFIHCKPRLDQRLNQEKTNFVSLGTDEGIDLSAVFVAFPLPNVTWFFENDVTKFQEELTDLDDWLIIDDYYDKSTIETQLRKSVLEGDEFGSYLLYVENIHGNMNVSFKVVPHGPPDPPYDVDVNCITSDEAVLSWQSGFNRGAEQYFIIQYKEITGTYENFDQIIKDSGNNISESIDQLESNQAYVFTVNAVNQFGTTASREEVNCTTAAVLEPIVTPKQSAVSIVVGAIVTSAVLVGVILIIVIIYRKIKTKKVEKKRKQAVRLRNKTTDVEPKVKILVSMPSDEIEEFDSGPYQEMATPTRKMSGVSNYYLDLSGMASADDVYEEMLDTKDTALYDEPEKPRTSI